MTGFLHRLASRTLRRATIAEARPRSRFEGFSEWGMSEPPQSAVFEEAATDAFAAPSTPMQAPPVGEPPASQPLSTLARSPAPLLAPPAPPLSNSAPPAPSPPPSAVAAPATAAHAEIRARRQAPQIAPVAPPPQPLSAPLGKGVRIGVERGAKPAQEPHSGARARIDGETLGDRRDVAPIAPSRARVAEQTRAQSVDAPPSRFDIVVDTRSARASPPLPLTERGPSRAVAPATASAPTQQAAPPVAASAHSAPTMRPPSPPAAERHATTGGESGPVVQIGRIEIRAEAPRAKAATPTPGMERLARLSDYLNAPRGR